MHKRKVQDWYKSLGKNLVNWNGCETRRKPRLNVQMSGIKPRNKL